MVLEQRELWSRAELSRRVVLEQRELLVPGADGPGSNTGLRGLVAPSFENDFISLGEARLVSGMALQSLASKMIPCPQ